MVAAGPKNMGYEKAPAAKWRMCGIRDIGVPGEVRGLTQAGREEDYHGNK
jgi:hypothetical protein